MKIGTTNNVFLKYLVFLFVTCIPIPSFSISQTKFATLIQALQSSIEEDQQKSEHLQQELEAAEVAIGHLSKEMTRLNSNLADEQKAVTHLKTNQEKYYQDLKAQTTVINQQIRTAYLLGAAQQWKIILNQQDPNTINRHFAYYRYLSKSRIQVISRLKKTLLNFAKTIAASRQHEATLKQLLAEKAQQQEKQKRFIAIRQELIQHLAKQTTSKQQQLQALLKNQRHLQETINRLRQSQPDSNALPFSHLQKKLSWPVSGTIVAPYGTLLDTGNRLTGIVIKVPAGTPVHAIYQGKVIFANWLRGFGLLVIIDHGNNYMSLYARNQAIYADVGNYVNTGDIVALSGGSGGYNYASLYFEIRKNGIPTNPTLWCKSDMTSTYA